MIEFRLALRLSDEFFDDRLDDEVAILQVGEAGRSFEVGQDLVHLRLGHLAALDAFGEETADAVHALLEGLVADLANDHGMALLGAYLGDAGAHEPAADDADRLNRHPGPMIPLRPRDGQGLADARTEIGR